MLHQLEHLLEVLKASLHGLQKDNSIYQVCISKKVSLEDDPLSAGSLTEL